MMRASLGLSVAGIALAVLAILRDDRHIAWVAIGVLGVALVLRGVMRWRRRRQRDDEDAPLA